MHAHAMSIVLALGGNALLGARHSFEHFMHVLNVPSNQPNRAGNMDVKFFFFFFFFMVALLHAAFVMKP